MLGLALSLALTSSGNPPPITAELVPAGEPLDLVLILKLADEADAKNDLRKNDKTPITAQEASDRYGQSPETFRRLQTWVRSAGFSLKDTEGAGRLAIYATGTAGQVPQLVGVRLHRVRDQPPKIHAPDGKPRLPEWVEKAVSKIQGLDNRPGQVKPPKKPR